MSVDVQGDVELQGVAQVAFTVHDVAEARAFYRDVLQLKFLFDAGNMAFFQCGDVRLMVGQGERASAPGEAIVYLRVADIVAAASTLEARGVTFVQQPHMVARMKSHDLWLAFLKDPSGNVLGLMSEAHRAATSSDTSPSA